MQSKHREVIVGDRSTQPISERNAVLVLRGVSKRYSSGMSTITVLDGVDLEVPQGGLSVIYGKSGSGKSTLLGLAAGLDAPDRGEVITAGESLTGKTSEALAAIRLRNIGIVFQFFNLLPTLSLAENVSLPARLAGSPRKDAEQRAFRLLERVGIRDLAGRLPSEVSGGEMQRAAIARALVNRPTLLLADEPTGNLDEANAAAVLTLFLDLARSESVSFLVVTHDPALISGADHRFLLEHGRIRETTGGV